MDIKRLIAKGLRAVLQPPAITDSFIDKKAYVCSGTQVNRTHLDRYSYIGHNGFLLNVEIGPFSSIADNCFIGGDEHALSFVSTSPVFHSGKNVLKRNFSSFDKPSPRKTVIGPDVWIGAGVTIKAGVNIGVGAVVGAGSVVTHDIPPYEIWAGNPARKIKNRFGEEIARGLIESEWWNWSEEKISGKADLFNNPDKFLDLI